MFSLGKEESESTGGKLTDIRRFIMDEASGKGGVGGWKRRNGGVRK